jgi:hypothetical protein
MKHFDIVHVYSISVLPSSAYNLRRNNHGILLKYPATYSKKTLGDHAFSLAVPKLWNNLPLAIRSSQGIFLLILLLFMYIYMLMNCSLLFVMRI